MAVKQSMKLTTALLLLHFSLLSVADSLSEANGRRAYIVYMGELPENRVSLMDEHHSLMSDAIGDEGLARDNLIYSYKRSFNGFAARLLPREAELLSERDGIVSVFESRTRKVLTTRSWDYLGMPLNVKRNLQIETDTIVGMLDTGVWPESESFNDNGFGPPPKTWRGVCQRGLNFSGCNNKLIGARYFNLAGTVDPKSETPLDTQGHGSHTASTAAGSAVKGASLYGIAEGTARGAVPSARISSYKVCWTLGCSDTDILAGFDHAIADGVDVISVSIGGDPQRFTSDAIAIGSFHAAKNGILTVCAAGNSGPYLGSIQNVAPWILTVAASTIDRQFVSDVRLGNGQKYTGIGINTFTLQNKSYPLTNGALAQASGDVVGNSTACEYMTLDKFKVEGKLMYCRGSGSDTLIRDLGGAAVIMSNDQMLDVAFSTLLPGTSVSLSDGWKIDQSPSGVVYKSRTIPIDAPAVATFSSRGPQDQTPNILKPDITAPGVNILAAFTIFATMTGEDTDDRIVKYNLDSGTSMATPHVSGAAAYVKTFHPDWSPAAIKSALMTTSTSLKIDPAEGELATGSGELSPVPAANPGLVYDIDTISYISFLCKEGYADKEISQLMGNKNYNCSTVPRAQGADGLNYPTFHLQVNATQNRVNAVYYRVVTNVEDRKATYKVEVKAPEGLSVRVTPNVLAFGGGADERKKFKVELKGKFLNRDSWNLRGSIDWVSDEGLRVRSPVVVYRQSNGE
ncbi:hypothetical protein M569_14877 [Genlisea aurea]|uniref:Uncharacterized protein n=1 Tax=Genlisea aurea TaxID=192259 RepID=S8DB51_9LAMI|nr:hypothetical protein M569_14877 [Genlisea aurea]